MWIPPYRAEGITEWFDECESYVSSDLDPVKELWEILDWCVSQCSPPPPPPETSNEGISFERTCLSVDDTEPVLGARDSPTLNLVFSFNLLLICLYFPQSLKAYCLAQALKLILNVIWESLEKNECKTFCSINRGLHVYPSHVETHQISLTFLNGQCVWLRLSVDIKASIPVMWLYIGHAVWNVPICLYVCVHVIYGSCWPSSELEALGTNVDDERLDIEGESSGS